MRQVSLFSVAIGIVFSVAIPTALATPTTVTVPGVPLPSGAPALPDLAVSGGGSLNIPPPPAPLPSPPVSGGSASLSGGVGGPGFVIQPTTITVDGGSLPGLP